MMVRLEVCFVVALVVAAACSVGPHVAPAVEIGTFNIRYDNPGDGDNAWPRRRAMVADVLREGDLWGLQEVLPQQVAALREDLPEFGMVVRSRDRDPHKGEACPILFRTARWSLDELDHGTFWLAETPDTAGSQSWDAALPRIATYARLIDASNGRGLYVFNVHLDHRGPRARLESCKLLARRIAARQQPDPVVVLGDFNAGPTSPPLRALLADATIGVVDAWRSAHPHAEERGTFSGWGESLGERRIDHVLPGPGLVVAACEIDERRPNGRWPSDHAPVRAMLRFGE
ncbi:MAG: endonuclease/exonuclease/phosphatase family protein [Planctomycetes bacterium]|nr:endonuclease/exonuclease/phosphatase family protein [Planctomycetota bacterium]